MIRTLAVAAGLAGAILLAPVAQAQPDSVSGPVHPNPGANGAAVARIAAHAPNKFDPIITAKPFGSSGTFVNQPGLAAANGNQLMPTGRPFGYSKPMQQGNPVGPASITSSFSGIRTRHSRTADK